MSSTYGPGEHVSGVNVEQEQKAVLTHALGRDEQAGSGVDETKHKVGSCEVADVDHGAAERGLHHTVSHADNEQKEERK